MEKAALRTLQKLAEDMNNIKSKMNQKEGSASWPPAAWSSGYEKGPAMGPWGQCSGLDKAAGMWKSGAGPPHYHMDHETDNELWEEEEDDELPQAWDAPWNSHHWHGGAQQQGWWAQSSSGWNPGWGNTQDLVQLEMLKAVQKLNQKKGEEDSSDDDNISKNAKGFKQLHRLRRRIKLQPNKLIAQFREETKRELNVTDARQVWSYPDLSRRVLYSFGKMKGLWKVHFYLASMLQLMDGGDHTGAHVYCVQLMKAVRQVAMDKGEWDTAQLLLPDENPLSRQEWAASEKELEEIYGYRKAVRELRSAKPWLGKRSDEKGDGKGKGKGKQDEAGKAADQEWGG